MLITKKFIAQHSTTLAFPKDVWVLNNATANETYILMQPFKGQLSDPTAPGAELAAAGYTASNPAFVSGLAINIEKGSEYKVLIQVSSEGLTQVYLLWQVEVLN